MVVIMKQLTIHAFGMVLQLSLIYSNGEIKLYEPDCDIPLSSLFLTDGRELELLSEDSVTRKVVQQLEFKHFIQEVPHHYGIFRKFIVLKNFL